MSSASGKSLQTINREVISCARCPRLRRYCRSVSVKKRRTFADEDYWGKPVPSFGDPEAELLIIGLAPAAHGGNRTGRVFTGDRSGDFLYSALYHAGFANQPNATHRDDGLRLTGAYITAIIHCAPPENKPEPVEIRRCRPFLVRELRALTSVRAVLALGQIAFRGFLVTLREAGMFQEKTFPKFMHGGVFELSPSLPKLFASYHPSQQNTQTGRLTQTMFDAVFKKIRRVLNGARTPVPWEQN